MICYLRHICGLIIMALYWHPSDCMLKILVLQLVLESGNWMDKNVTLEYNFWNTWQQLLHVMDFAVFLVAGSPCTSSHWRRLVNTSVLFAYFRCIHPHMQAYWFCGDFPDNLALPCFLPNFLLTPLVSCYKHLCILTGSWKLHILFNTMLWLPCHSLLGFFLLLHRSSPNCLCIFTYLFCINYCNSYLT